MPMTPVRFVLEDTTTLPMPPLAYGIIAFVVFLFLLGVTWAFRGTSRKYATGEHDHAAH